MRNYTYRERKLLSKFILDNVFPPYEKNKVSKKFLLSSNYIIEELKIRWSWTYNEAIWSGRDRMEVWRRRRKKIRRRRDASSSTESPCHKWDTRRGGQESRPDPKIPFSFSRPRRSAKIQRSRILCQTGRDPTAINHVQNRDRAAESMSKRCDVPWRVRKFRDTMTHSTKLNFLRHFARRWRESSCVFAPRWKSGRKRNALPYACHLYVYFSDRYRWKKKWKRGEKFPPLPERSERGEKRISCSLNNKFIAKERAWRSEFI